DPAPPDSSPAAARNPLPVTPQRLRPHTRRVRSLRDFRPDGHDPVVSPGYPALVAQLDRASDYGSEGWGFESLRARCTRAPLLRGLPRSRSSVTPNSG